MCITVRWSLLQAFGEPWLAQDLCKVCIEQGRASQFRLFVHIIKIAIPQRIPDSSALFIADIIRKCLGLRENAGSPHKKESDWNPFAVALLSSPSLTLEPRYNNIIKNMWWLRGTNLTALECPSRRWLALVMLVIYVCVSHSRICVCSHVSAGHSHRIS